MQIILISQTNHSYLTKTTAKPKGEITFTCLFKVPKTEGNKNLEAFLSNKARLESWSWKVEGMETEDFLGKQVWYPYKTFDNYFCMFFLVKSKAEEEWFLDY